MMMVITNSFSDLIQMLLRVLPQRANSLKMQTLKDKVSPQQEVITYLISWEWVLLIMLIRFSRQD